jgi:hemerythrin superfamily protein
VPTVEGRRDVEVNAIDLLERQHREVEELFEELEDAGESARATRERLCREISDQLAVHAEIEERLFYPESRQDDTEAILRESVEEHLSMKRLVAEIMEGGADDERFETRVKVLRDVVRDHVEEEEGELFPRVRKVCTRDELEDLGDRMSALAEKLLEESEPSRRIPGQTDRPAPI